VKPLKLKFLLPAGLLLLTAFLALGIIRDYKEAIDNSDVNRLTTSNEFQAVYATAYDLEQRKMEGSLTVPWQVYFNDFIALVPSQFLPFEKTDNGTWYLDVIGMKGEGVGFSFGAVSESVVGFGWIELILRGALIGLTFALLHRWYSRRASRFWPLVIYTWLSVFSYLTFRGTSFYLLVLLVYRMVPAIILVELFSTFLKSVRMVPTHVEEG
jgi:hypothetical protein